MTDAHRTPRRAWYEDTFLPFYARYAPLVIMFCLVLSAGAAVGTFFNQRAQDAEVAARQETTATLLDCFDKYANQSASVSKAVREAQVNVDQRTEVRDHALNIEGVAFRDFMKALVAGEITKPEDALPLLHALEHRADAAKKLEVAHAHLDAVREDNPVPDPPSQFCKLPE